MPDPVNVLLIGGGGREHAIAWKLAQSPRLGTLYTTHPENPGITACGARPVDVPVSTREIYRLQQFCDRNRIGLVVIGPEDPLADGWADKLAAPGRLIFGPSQSAARLESDKAWCKQMLRTGAIPTGGASIFTDPESARNYVETRAAAGLSPEELRDLDIRDRVQRINHIIERIPAIVTRAPEHERVALTISCVHAAAANERDPELRRKMIAELRRTNRLIARAYDAPISDLPVIKASGLAKGKGVILPRTLAEAIDAIDQIMVRRVFSDAGATVIIEEKLEGREVSVLALVDGRTICVLPPCQDHKRLLDDDEGPNTGGMGAYCPSNSIDEPTMARIEREILVPIVDTLRREGIEFRGVLYAGLMLTHAGPKVLEFNTRFGDPECQPLMMRLDSDLLELMLATASGTLDQADVRWKNDAACCVVIASPGYPDKPENGIPIHGVNELAAGPLSQSGELVVFQAGTKRDADAALATAGGRVLGVTALGHDLAQARERAYAACEKISFKGMHYRRDIGLTESMTLNSETSRGSTPA
ncbi:MAG: phosphoribosylamine--glycine ligase [Phycisphaerales bacterium]|jgi:phosphoribosylamine--glycine ligase|nr:phosphoribosylamine--glycine ligase [Phycisphaerales bacterium]